jgi:hypothetical protein
MYTAETELQLSHCRLASSYVVGKKNAPQVYTTVLTHQLLCESANSEPIDSHKRATVPYVKCIIHNMHAHQLLQSLLQQCTPLTAGLHLHQSSAYAYEVQKSGYELLHSLNVC